MSPQGTGGVVEVDISITREAGDWPEDAEWLAERAALAALSAVWDPADGPAEMSVVLADDALVRTLNRDYRGKDKPTNVLSFALTEADGPDAEDAPTMLGDVVLAWETLVRESAEQDKTLSNHLCHLVVHGVLHLLGYDHEVDAEAEEMERLEVEVLGTLGVPDPYATASSEDRAPKPPTTGR